MESTVALPSLPQIEDHVRKFKLPPREGQLKAFRQLARCHGGGLNVKLPTGYGKTYVALGVYSTLKAAAVVNRHLIIVPTTSQLDQMLEVGRDFSSFGIEGPADISNVHYYGSECIKRHLSNRSQTFVTTIQALKERRGMDVVQKMVQKGRWMMTVDEYHHYGEEKAYSRAVTELLSDFRLCMSATPQRPKDDMAFGEPDVEVSYREAKKEGAVKPMVGHSYHYRVDAMTDDETVSQFTTEELIAEAGGDSPEAIERLLILRKMRWSPKYVSPLVTVPLDRMSAQRLQYGIPLKAIAGAMCVSHAKLVCQQIRSVFPHFRTEWVGTGRDGRSPSENREIVNSFRSGEPGSVDVLVHVGIAGEGLDTVYVSEVIHLNAAGVNNSNNQENGRGARVIRHNGKVVPVVCHVSFDACSGFAMQNYVGSAIMDAMDFAEPSKDDEDQGSDDLEEGELDWIDLPPSLVEVQHVELDRIDKGDEDVKQVVEYVAKNTSGVSVEEVMEDLNHPLWDQGIKKIEEVRRRAAESFNEEAQISKWEDDLNRSVRVLAGNVARRIGGLRHERSLVGDLCKRINSKKKSQIGAKRRDLDCLREHYKWITDLEQEIKQGGVPSWLG